MSASINDELDTWHRAEALRQAELTRYTTLQEISESYGVAMSTLRQWVDEGKIPTYSANGHHRRVRVEDAERLMKPVPPKSKAAARKDD